MKTNDLIKILNDKGYVVVLFNPQDFSYDDIPQIPIGYIQSQISGFQSELDETFSNIMETLYEDDYQDD